MTGDLPPPQAWPAPPWLGPMGPRRVFLGLGANSGNREANMRLALAWLAPACEVVAVSSLYRSEAVVLEGQPAGPDYLNAACEVRTSLAPHDLLRLLKRIEHDIGRRPAGRWAARPIDLDILLYGDTIIESGDLTVPHPLLAGRNFVLLPLAELAPEAMHPLITRTIGELAEEIAFDGLEHIAGPEWASQDVGTRAEPREEGDE